MQYTVKQMVTIPLQWKFDTAIRFQGKSIMDVWPILAKASDSTLFALESIHIRTTNRDDADASLIICFYWIICFRLRAQVNTSHFASLSL